MPHSIRRKRSSSANSLGIDPTTGFVRGIDIKLPEQPQDGVSFQEWGAEILDRARADFAPDSVIRSLELFSSLHIGEQVGFIGELAPLGTGVVAGVTQHYMSQQDLDAKHPSDLLVVVQDAPRERILGAISFTELTLYVRKLD